ncbi:MAG TPA: AmmeMemoRadiSam system radical SAM enzyme [Clostridiales bacterium]|nr:AmmeMemoRadiSam system radical SAM enzyme [Clostridiales bacterium]
MSKTECKLCPHHCRLDENQTGLCNARSNAGGEIVPVNYGEITCIALDPVEKKPLRHFYPGSKILSAGSYGCNLKCSFCQNYEISAAEKNDIKTQRIIPENLIQIAMDLLPRGNIGIAYTYNEPLVGYEYVRDCAMLAAKKGLKNVVVTNGCFCEDPIEEMLPFIDAFNVDLKGFTEKFYNDVGGNLETVKRFIKLVSENSHVEVTTLVIPDENDSEEEITELSRFIASVNKDIPLHISRFFPCYKMSGKRPTDVKKVYKLAETARKQLNYVYEGNC